MALKDKIELGISLPHRSPEPIDMGELRRVAQRAEALGFRDLWVTENTLDHVFCFDPVVILTYAAAVTTKIRLGASVVVLPIHSPLMVAHQWACLDYVSQGRAILGVGLGRDHHYRQFEVPEEGRGRRFREGGGARLWRGGGPQKGALDGRQGHLSRPFLPPRERDDGAEAGAEAAGADLDGRRPSRCAAPHGAAGRWLDGLGGGEQGGLRAIHTDPEGGIGGAGARPGDFPDLEARLSLCA